MQEQNGTFMEPPDEQTQADGAEPSARCPGEKPGVLVVDDEHMVRAMVQLGLERNGFKVRAASNGREAIELYRAHREDIAVVLLDVRMPELDGPQTLDALRELNSEVLACFMTGDPGDYQWEELRRHGAAQIIAKPFHLSELANILRPLAHGAPADVLS